MKKATAESIMNQVRKVEDSCRIAAFVVLKGAVQVGTIRIKYPAQGHGERMLQAHVADWGTMRPADVPFENFTRWQIGKATGYGYDKASAALSDLTIAGFTFQNSGQDWSDQLREHGLTLLRAI